MILSCSSCRLQITCIKTLHSLVPMTCHLSHLHQNDTNLHTRDFSPSVIKHIQMDCVLQQQTRDTRNENDWIQYYTTDRVAYTLPQDQGQDIPKEWQYLLRNDTEFGENLSGGVVRRYQIWLCTKKSPVTYPALFSAVSSSLWILRPESMVSWEYTCHQPLCIPEYIVKTKLHQHQHQANSQDQTTYWIPSLHLHTKSLDQNR